VDVEMFRKVPKVLIVQCDGGTGVDGTARVNGIIGWREYALAAGKLFLQAHKVPLLSLQIGQRPVYNDPLCDAERSHFLAYPFRSINAALHARSGPAPRALYSAAASFCWSVFRHLSTTCIERRSRTAFERTRPLDSRTTARSRV